MNKLFIYAVILLMSCMSTAVSGQSKDVMAFSDSLKSVSDSARVRELVLQKGRYLKSMMRYDEAAEVFALLLQDNRLDKEAVAEMADCNYMDGNYSGAMTFYRMLSMFDPDNLVANIRLMQISFRGREYPECIGIGRTILQLDSIPAVCMLLGDAFNNTGQRDSALVYYREALRLRPLYPNVIDKMSDILLSVGRYDEVIAISDSYLSERPDNIKVNLAKGMAQYLKKDYKSSLETFSTLQTLGDDSYGTHFMLGQNLWHLDRTLEAEEELMKAYAIDSTEVALVLLIASVKAELLTIEAGLLNAGKDGYSEMDAWFDKALAMMEPDGKMMSEIWRRRGYAYYKLKNWSVARKYYEKVLKYDTSNVNIYMHLGFCCHMEKEWKDALQYYRKGLELSEPGTQLRKYLQDRVVDMEREVFMYEK